MNAKSGRTTALTASALMSLAALTGAATTAAAASTPVAQTAVPIQLPADLTGHTYTLPTGDIVTVHGTGSGATYTVHGPDGRPAQAIEYDVGNGHAYVVPLSVIADDKGFDQAQFDIPALASAPAPPKPAVVPHYAMNILQVNATDLTGAPAVSAMTLLTNVDSVQRWGNVIPVVNGVARAAVPAGHYAAYTIFVTRSTGGPLNTEVDTDHVVVQNDLTVPQTGGVTTLTADERTATSQVTAATPRPSTTDVVQALLTRTDAAGQKGNLQLFGNSLWLSPQPKPQLGTLSYELVWGGGDPYGKDPYHYDLMYGPVDHIDANQTWPVDPHKLAVQHNTFDTDEALANQRGFFGVGAFLPNGGGGSTAVYPMNPSHLTEYVSAPMPGAQWTESYAPNIGFGTPIGSVPPLRMFVQPRVVSFVPGTETWRSWAHGPLTPQIGQVRGAGAVCGACADGSTLDMAFPPLVDSEPDTEILPLGAHSTHFSLYRDDTQIFSQDMADGAEVTGVPQQAGTYRAVFDMDMSGSGLSQSTGSHTDVTFPYRPTGDPALPAGDMCQAQGASTTPCQILPVLNLTYHLRTDGIEVGDKPVQKLDLTVGHQSFDGLGSHAAVTGATVSASFDGGKTWTAAKVTKTGGGHFTAQWPNSAAKGTTPWLRVTATDAIGGAISQTVDNAYTIG